MKPTTKQLLMSLLNYITIIAMLMNFVFPVADLARSVSAQDTTEEPVIEETVAPTEAPPSTEPITDVVTEIPAETATSEPTAIMTEEPAADTTEQPTITATDESTAEVTTEPTIAPTEPPNILLFFDDFTEATTDGWLLTPGWQLVSEADNIFLSTSAPNETATILSVGPADFALSANVRVAWGNKANLVFRAGTENYTLTLDMVTNTASLYRGANLLGQAGLTVPAADENGIIPQVWYPITIFASGSSISVTVDSVVVANYVDPSPLPAGAIIFVTDAANTGGVSIDDVAVSQVIPGIETPVATEPVVVTETPDAPTEATPEVTTEVVTTEEPVGQLLLSADFEGELIGWSLSEGSSIITDGDANHALLLTANAQLSPFEAIVLADFQLNARFHILSDAADGTPSGLNIPFRTQEGTGYILSVEAGQTTLYRDDGETRTLISGSPTPHALNTWHTLSLEARGGHIVVTINGTVEVDATEAEPLLNGQLAFVANNASNVMLDDISIVDFSDNAFIAATPEPFVLSDEESAKLPGTIVDVINLYITGDQAGALALAQANLLPMDEAGRVSVVVLGAEGETGAVLASLIETVGGAADFIYDTTVEARIPLSGFVALVNTPQVALIKLSSTASSTALPVASPSETGAAAPAGAVVGEGFDIISANDWHLAALTGTSQFIGLIDTGFVGVTDSGEWSCLRNGTGVPAGGDDHGSKVLQVLCDVAPSANVTLYRATNASELNTRLTQAASANSIILITMDLGVDVSAGDGTGANATNAATTLYTNLQNQRNNGKLIIVSAGNNNWWEEGGSRIGRYFGMSYSTAGSNTIEIPVSAVVGDMIRISWNDWAGTPPTRENFDIRLGVRTIRDATAGRIAGDDPSIAFPVIAADCPASPCNLTLSIGGTGGVFADAGSVFFQVQISGEGTINGSGISNATVNFNAGNLARPADSPAVVTVGAVCARANLNYPVLPESSVGPVYADGGSGPAALPGAPTRANFKPDLVGPSDVSVSGSIVGDDSGNECNEFDTKGFSGTSSAAAYVAGMAALIQQNASINIRPAGGWTANGIIDYMQSHSIDLPRNDAALGTVSNGFDRVYGAGLTVLGDPAPTAPINPDVTPDTVAVNAVCNTGTTRYVRPGNVGSTNLNALGSASNPFIHVADALADANANSCIVLLPGEYVSGIHVDDNNPDGIKLRSYKSIVPEAEDSIIWSNNGMAGGQGAVAITNNSMSVYGIVFKPSNPSNLCSPLASDPVSFPRPIAIHLSEATGNIISGNTISGFRVGVNEANTCFSGASAPLQVSSSSGVTIEDNTFTDNMVQSAAAISVASNESGAAITIQRNLFKNNVPSADDALNPACDLPVVRIDYAITNLYNNKFVQNGTCVMLRINDGSSFTNPNDFTGTPVVVFGNVFTRNTNTRPLVQLLPARRFRFINNTVAGNNQISNVPLISRGEANGNNGGGLIDIHNNVFYDNSGLSLFDDIAGDFLCFSNDQTPTANPLEGQGTRNNWSFNSGGAGAECSIPFGNAALNNSIDVNDPLNPFDDAETSEFVGEELGGDDAYRLKSFSFGIGYANDTNQVFNFNPGLLSGQDAIGNQRVSGTDGLDVGAYEYKPVTGTPFTSTFAEDYVDPTVITNTSGLPVIKIPLSATGGFEPYTFQLVSNPANYSTDINNYCGGLPVRFDQSTNPPSVYYCPPRHFYNSPSVSPDSGVSFSYRVVDKAGNISDPANVTLTITSGNYSGNTANVNDTNLVTPIGTSGSPYTIVGVVSDPPTPIDYRLRPYVRFGNFRISAPGNPLLGPSADGLSGSLEADFPYTYVTGSISFPSPACPPTCDNPNLFGDGRAASQAHITAQFNAIGANGGVLRLTPLAGQTGFMDFTYNARDARNNTTTNHVRILVVGDLPDSGLHDDTSFTWNYYGSDLTQSGAWNPIYSEASINNTLHTSTTVNDTAEFLFDGVGFALYMQGSTAGGNYQVKIENGGVEENLTWQPVTGVVGTLQATNGAITCRTTALAVVNQPTLLSNRVTGTYTVSCSGFLDGEANKVIVTNKQQGRNVSIDAIGILQNSSPLLPGVHEVTETQMLPVLFDYTPITDARASGTKAAYTTDVNDDIRFTFQGHGFAIGTALQRSALRLPVGEPLGVQYRICVSDVLDLNNKLCQRYDNSIGATTVPAWNTFRTFFGFDPEKTYEVTVDIINIPNYSGSGASAVPLRFYIDSIVIFDGTNQPTGTLPLGITEDDQIGTINFGGGLADSWLFNSNFSLASNRSLTSVVTTVPKVGPFINFIVPAGADTINWFQNGTRNTTQALICVDRARLTVPGGEAGNCIVMNTRTGIYQQVQANGLLGNPTSFAPGINPLVISQEMFRLPWGTGAPHIIEISSLTNETFNLDKVQVVDADAPLTAGYYEENATNLRWFTESQIPTPSFDLGQPSDSGNFIEVVNSRASGGRIRVLNSDSQPTVPGNDKENLREGMFFQFNGTGFSVYFTFDAKADAVRICWIDDGGSPATPSSALIETVLTTGTCQTFDNQSAAVRYRAARTIAGLKQSNYSVVVQMLDDQGEPALHTGVNAFLTMQIDAVEIYNNTTSQVLDVVGQRYETNFTTSTSDGLFTYLGTGWRTISGTAARLYSGSNYDTVVNVIGAGVTFRTLNGSNVVIYRNTRSNIAPMQVCVNQVNAPFQRRCTIIYNNGASGGYQQPITVPLFDTTEHVVSITTTDVGTFILDAIEVTNTPLQPGIYDENDPALVYSTTIDLQRPVYSHWKDVTLASYTGGGAMETSTIGATVTFEFEGTGFSLITLFNSLGADAINVSIDGATDFNFTVSNYLAATRYGSSHSFSGLPYGEYTVTITEAGTTRHKLLIDGVEIYGYPDDPSYYDPAKELEPGFYDNAAAVSTGPVLTFGPNNGTWVSQIGATTGTAFNQTRHFTNRHGATFSFEIQDANAITLYHNLSTTSKLQICAIEVGEVDRRCNTDAGAPAATLPQSLIGRNNTTYSDPYLFPGGVGNYYVSVTNMDHGRNLYVDAVSVQDASVLTEGIYEERHPGLTFESSWNIVTEVRALDRLVQAGTGAGQSMTFTFQGIGFSIIIAESTSTTSNDYSLCVDQGTSIGTCATINLASMARENTTTARKPVALTYVGFNPDLTYTVRLTNNDSARMLLVDRVDILGPLDSSEQIGAAITGGIENTDPRIVYFPFFTYKTTNAALASGGNQSIGLVQGSIAYFELDSVPLAGRSIEFVRQTLSSYSRTEICSAPLETLSTNGAACAGNITGLPENPLLNNVAPFGYQKPQSMLISGNNNDRWVILRNLDGKAMPVDFVRQLLGDEPLTTGQYDDAHPGLRWFTEADDTPNANDPRNGQVPNGPYTLLPSGQFGNFTSLAAPAHYGGSIRVLREDFDPATTPPPAVNDHLNLYEGMYFQFTGTGFGIGFALDNKADAVNICWIKADTTDINSILTDPASQCQVYDNQSAAVRYQAFRNILGLDPGTYSVVVQMLEDQGAPAVHPAAHTPIAMQIDSVKVYDGEPTPALDNLDVRYETSFANSTTDQTFQYYGTGWTSISGTAARLYSGTNYDRVTGVIGASVTFRTTGANSITLYRNTRPGYAPVEVCAQRPGDLSSRTCTTVPNNLATGVSVPFPILLNDSGSTAEHIVSITTLDAGMFILDAIQLINTNAPLLPGTYEDSYPGFIYTDAAGTGPGNWSVVASAAYTGGRARQTTGANPTTGDMLNFSFTGTGFEVSMGIDRYGGEVEVCYDNETDWDDASDKCFVYQNESIVASNLVTRSVAGLAQGTYHVRIQHVEDGQTTIGVGGARATAYAQSRLRIDNVTIFGSVPLAEITEGGIYNENATDGSSSYLQLLPAERWFSFTGRVAAAFSDQSYVGVVDTRNRLVSTYAGPVAVMRLNIGDSATVIINTGAATSANTGKLLVCANDVDAPAPTAPNVSNETDLGTNCTVITDLKTSNQFVLNGENLPPLATGSAVTLTFRSLVPGMFRIDSFQVIEGNVLSPGLYDDFLFSVGDPLVDDDVLIGVNATGTTAGTWILAPHATTKLRTAYGGTQALALSTNSTGDDPTLRFKFEGTGFSIITTADSLGVDFRVCYVALENGELGFDGTLDGVTSPPVGNQDYSVEICDTATTDTVPPVATNWANFNNGDPKPSIAYQYGLTYTGLRAEQGTYLVEVRLNDSLMGATDRLKVDAIAIFSDVTDTGHPALVAGDSGQLYDETAPGILFEPSFQWKTVTTTVGPTRGAWNKSQKTTTNAGAIVQLNVTGNGVIIYQSVGSTGSRRVRVCLTTHVGQECGEYAQYPSAVKYFTPIAFYGFGTGNHQLVIENRDPGRVLSIDGVRVLP